MAVLVQTLLRSYEMSQTAFCRGIMTLSDFRPGKTLLPNSDQAFPSIKVLLVDGSEIVRRGILRLLESAPELQLVGVADDLEAGFSLATEYRPKITVIDLSMVQKTDSAKPAFTAMGRILAMSAYPADSEEIKEMAAAIQAAAFVDKMQLSEKLVSTILQIARPQTQ